MRKQITEWPILLVIGLVFAVGCSPKHLNKRKSLRMPVMQNDQSGSTDSQQLFYNEQNQPTQGGQQNNEQLLTPIMGNRVDIQQFSEALNDYRRNNNLATLRYNISLTEYAAENNRLQIKRGLGHHKMGAGVYAQNSASGYSSVQQVMNGWHRSRGHRVNLRSTKGRCFGIHWLERYWTLNIGACN
jgi:uncharacterized protein YkwD